MQKEDAQTVAVLKEGRDEILPSKERFDAMFASLMAGKTPEESKRLPRVSPFGQISGILNSNMRDIRITAVRGVNGIALVFDRAISNTPRQIGKFASAAWRICVKHLD